MSVKIILEMLFVIATSSAVLCGQTVKGDGSFKPIEGEVVFYKSKKTSDQIREDFSRLKFEIELSKANYLLLEPVVLKCSFSNPTGETLDIYRPELVNHLGMKTIRNGKSEINRNLFGINVNTAPVIQPLQPGEVIEEVLLLQPNDGLFRNVGGYEVQFFLSDLGGGLFSNSVNVMVNRPEVENEDAYNYLRSHPGSFYNLFYTEGVDNAARQSTLETFVGKFSNSVYYEYAVLGLSNLYVATEQSEKARDQLLKIRNSQNRLFNEIVRTKLSKKLFEK